MRKTLALTIAIGVTAFGGGPLEPATVSAQPPIMGGAPAGMQIPDMKQMSGIPRPVGDLPNGAITVRVVRGSLSNNIANQEVELSVGGTIHREKTDDTGHVEFKGLPVGAAVKALAVVDGERLESQEFTVPTQGGVRLMLVATDKDAEKKKAEEASAPAMTGQVVLGGQSRIVMEPGDEAVQVYYLLDIVNTARVPVNPPSVFMFDMPRAAVGTTVLEGSSPQASVNGTRVRVQGPFKPGTTTVQIACELPFRGGSLEFTQRFPANMEQLAMIAKKTGAMRLVSPQLSAQQDMTAEGQAYIAASGGVVPAGAPIDVKLDDLPHHSTAPRTTALTFAAVIVVLGVWALSRKEDPRSLQAERQRLVERREKLFGDLVRIENDARRGRGDAGRQAARRAEILAALEHVYGALDESPDDGAGLDTPSRSTSRGELRAS